MEVQEPEKRPNEGLRSPANTAASPEESKSSIQAQEFDSKPDLEALSKNSEMKPYPEGSSKDSHRPSEREGFSEDSDNEPCPEGSKQVLGQKPEGFNEDPGRKPYLENLNKDPASKHFPEDSSQDSGSKVSNLHDSERESDPVDESVLQELNDLESSHTPAQRTSTSSPSKLKSSRRRKSFSVAGQKMCRCAASSAADCAAVCCCPCVLAHLLVLALVKVPHMIAMKVFRYTKRKARISKKKKKSDEDEDGSGKKVPSYQSGWSLSPTPHFSGYLDGSPPRTAEEQKEENQKFWQDLYAGGHMGFGGPSLERD